MSLLQVKPLEVMQSFSLILHHHTIVKAIEIIYFAVGINLDDDAVVGVGIHVFEFDGFGFGLEIKGRFDARNHLLAVNDDFSAAVIAQSHYEIFDRLGAEVVDVNDEVVEVNELDGALADRRVRPVVIRLACLNRCYGEYCRRTRGQRQIQIRATFERQGFLEQSTRVIRLAVIIGIA